MNWKSVIVLLMGCRENFICTKSHDSHMTHTISYSRKFRLCCLLPSSLSSFFASAYKLIRFGPYQSVIRVKSSYLMSSQPPLSLSSMISSCFHHLLSSPFQLFWIHRPSTVGWHSNKRAPYKIHTYWCYTLCETDVVCCVQLYESKADTWTRRERERVDTTSQVLYSQQH